MRFGTDGVRFTVHSPNLSNNLVRLGYAIGKVCNDRGFSSCALCTDTRESKDVVKVALLAGLLSHGIHVTDCGIVPTGLFSTLVKCNDFNIGLAITASHNPPEYNGVKIIDRYGHKLADHLESEIESVFEDCHTYSIKRLGTLTYMDGRTWCYEYLNSLWRNMSLSGLRIVLDFAHGATGWLGDAPFRTRGAKTFCLGSSCDGSKINSTGCMNTSSCCVSCSDLGYDVGFCFDGDGDRMLICSPQGQIIDGDGVLAMLINHGQSVLSNPIKGVVGTVLSNSGLEFHAAQKGLRFHRAQVGDKNVVNDMIKLKYELGGEPSGHVFLAELGYLGDGMVNALLISAIMAKTRASLSELLEGYKPVPQKIFNYKLVERKSLLEDSTLTQTVQDFETRGVRVLVRYSGTEPLVRIMTESFDEDLAEEAHRTVVKILRGLGVIQ